MPMTRERRPAIRTMRGWAIAVLQEAGTIRECEEHGWMQDRADSHARERAFDIARVDSSDEFAHLAQGLLHTERNASWGLNALIGIGERGVELIGHWLQGRNAAKRTDSDDVAIRVLYSHPTTRALSVRAAVDRCLRGHFLLDGPYDIAAESEEPAIREQILDKAFAARPIAATQSLRAIEGLATFDAVRAVEAIEVGLHSQPALERQLCRLLVRVAFSRSSTDCAAASPGVIPLRPKCGVRIQFE